MTKHKDPYMWKVMVRTRLELARETRKWKVPDIVERMQRIHVQRGGVQHDQASLIGKVNNWLREPSPTERRVPVQIDLHELFCEALIEMGVISQEDAQTLSDYLSFASASAVTASPRVEHSVYREHFGLFPFGGLTPTFRHSMRVASDPGK